MIARRVTLTVCPAHSSPSATLTSSQGTPPENEIPVADHFLQCAVEDGESEQHIAERVAATLSSGTSWKRVAEILRMPVGEAERRFAHLRAGTSQGRP